MSVKTRRKSKDLPVDVRQVLAILHKWGIHTLGQFASLDKDDLNARLGPEAVRLWERANGQSTRLLKLVQPPESFIESFEFEHDVETVEPLLFMLRRFLQQLALRLDAIYLVAKELTLRITFSDQKCYERGFQIPQPTDDVDLLFRMLHTHLENFKSEQPITAVSLEAQPVQPARQQFGLFETALRDPNRLSETLARLTALLGADRVGTPVLEETFRSDAFHLEPFSWQVGAIDLNRPPGGTTSVSSHYSSDATERIPPFSSRLYAVFVLLLPLWFSRTKISRLTFEAPKLPVKSQRKRDRMRPRAIGGMKRDGAALSGMCNWRTALWRAVIKPKTVGRSMAFTIRQMPHSGRVCLTSSSMLAVRLVFCAALHFPSN